MRRLLPYVFAFAFTVAAASFAAAADPQTAPQEGRLQLSLAEAIQIALEQSPRAQSAASRSRQADAELLEAGAVLEPRFTAVGEMNYGTIPAQGPPPSDPETLGQFTLSYNQIAWRSHDIRQIISQRELTQDLAHLRAESELLALVNDVTQSYVAVIEAESAANVGRVLAHNAQDALRVARDRYEVGTATAADVLAAEAASARAALGAEIAATSLRLATDVLFQTLGMDPHAGGVHLQDLDVLVAASEPVRDLDALVQRAQSSRPEVLQAKAGLEIARIALVQTSSANRPRAELQGRYLWNEDDRSFSLTLTDSADLQVALSQGHNFTTGVSGQPIPDVWRVGARVVWNFADGGASAQRERQAHEQVIQAELQLKQVTNGLSLELARHYDEVAHALQDLIVAEQELLEVQQRLGAMRQQFETGVATQFSVSQTEAELVRAEHTRVQAMARLTRAQVALATASGISARGIVERLP